MGNRAVITVKGSTVGVYLHWNGGVESVTAFLRAAKDLGVRSPEKGDDSYFYARFVQIVSNFFGGTTSIGIDSMQRLDCDNGDNGVYVVGRDFRIVARKHAGVAPTELHGELAARSEAIYQATMDANRPIFKRAE